MLTRFCWLSPAAALASRRKRSTKVASLEVPLQQHLDGDVPAEGEVLAQIHVGHAAAAELAHDAVAAADHLFWLEHVAHVRLPLSFSVMLTTTGARSLPVRAGRAAPAPP